MAAKLEGDQLEFRNLLVEHKRRLWAELRDEVFRQAGEEVHTQYEEFVPDLGEQSLLDVISDAGLAVADIRKEELTHLDEAEKRLESGTYGICENCGEPIGLDRLRLVPFTAYCVACQQAHEEQEGPPKGSGVTM
jgi:DnaK suppressor protein